MGSTINTEYVGVNNEYNVDSYELNKNTAYTLTFKKNDGTTAVTSADLKFSVDGDDVHVIGQDQYALTVSLSGTIGDDEIGGIYAFSLEKDPLNNEAYWTTTYLKEDGSVGTIKLADGDLRPLDADPKEAALADYANVKADASTFTMVRTIDGVAKPQSGDGHFNYTDYLSAAHDAGANWVIWKTEYNFDLTLEDYALAQPADTTLTIGGKTLNGGSSVTEIVMPYDYDEATATYTGSRFRETVTLTDKDETLNLGTSKDIVNANGDFGDNVATTNKGELFDYRLNNVVADNDVDLVTAGKQNGMVLKSNGTDAIVSTDVEYYITAKVKATAIDNTQPVVWNSTEWDTEEVTHTFKLVKLTATGDPVNHPIDSYAWVDVTEGYQSTADKSGMLLEYADINAGSVAPFAVTNGTLGITEITAYQRINGVETVVPKANLFGGAADEATLNARNEVLFGYQTSGSITFKDFAADANLAGTVQNNTQNIDDGIINVFTVEGKGGVFTGSRLTEVATSTSANESFNMGAGYEDAEHTKHPSLDTINFSGNFGHDTVAVNNLEKVNLKITDGGAAADLKGALATMLTYSTDGEDVTISTQVKYYATATITTSGEGIYNGVKYVNNSTHRFELEKCTVSPVAAFEGHYVWRDQDAASTSPTDGSRMVLDYSDINGSADYTGLQIALTNVKVWQEINGVATEVTAEYVAATGSDALVASKNDALFGYQAEGSITLTGYARAEGVDAPVVVVNDSTYSGANDIATKVTFNETITDDYEGSRLKENITVAAEVDKDLVIDVADGNNSVNASAAKGGKFTIFGGDGNDTVYGGKDVDFIDVGIGINEVTAGKGDDIILAGELTGPDKDIKTGTNTLHFSVGDGNDIVYLNGATDTLVFDQAVGYASSQLSYDKDGDNLVIYRTSVKPAQPGAEVDTVTIFGYFNADAHSTTIRVQDYGISPAVPPINSLATILAAHHFEIEGKGTIDGSFAIEDITTTGDAIVTAGKADDSITLAKDSSAALVFNVGDGDDTVTMGDAEAVVLQFNDAKPTAAGNYWEYNYTYAENIHVDAKNVYDAADQLVVTRTAQQYDKNDNPVGGLVTDTVTIKDYLNKGEGKVFIGDELLEDVATVAPAAAATMIGSFLSETITGTAGADLINTGAGDDVITQTPGNDSYIFGAGDKAINADFTTAFGTDSFTLGEDVGSVLMDFTKGETVTNVTLADIQAGYTGIAESFANDSLTLTSANGVATISDYLKNGEGTVYVKFRAVDENGDPLVIDGDPVYDTALLEDIIPAAAIAQAVTEGKEFKGSFLAETITGTAKADTIYANGGDDVIVGGEGNDILYGGEGANVFRFATNSGNDTVYMSGEGELLEFAAPAVAGVTFDMTKEDTYQITSTFSEDKKDVIITVTAKGTKDAKEVVYTDTITLKNYMEGAAEGTKVSYKVWNPSTKTYVDSGIVDITALVDTSSLIDESGNKVVGTDLADNIVFTDNKGRSIYGEGGNDYIEVAGGANKLYGGDGNDILVGGVGADTFDGGAGNNVFRFFEGDGKDTVINGAGVDSLEFYTNDPMATVTTAVKGKDLVFTYGDNKDTVTIKDYVATVTSGVNHSVQSYSVNGAAPIALTAYAAINGTPGTDDRVFEVKAPDPEKAANLKGSTLSEEIYGTEGKNNIKGGGGNDVIYSVDGANKISTDSRGVDLKKGILVADDVKVYAGRGTDDIKAGKGHDTYVFSEGMLNGSIDANNVGTVTIDLSQNNFTDLQFSVSGKNLIISNTFDPYAAIPGLAGRTTTVEKLVVKNYANDKLTNNIFINDGSGEMRLYDYIAQITDGGVTLGNAFATKAQNLKGTFLDETFLGGAGKDTISTGAGKDAVYAGAGDDKITGFIAKDGKNLNYFDEANAKLFAFDYDYDKALGLATGSGNDTITNAKISDAIVFRFNDANIKDSASQLADSLTFNKKGNDLVIGYINGVDAKGNAKLTDSITVKNYYGKNVLSVQTIGFVDEDGNMFADIDLVNDVENGALKAAVKTAIKTAANTAQGYADNAHDIGIDATGVMSNIDNPFAPIVPAPAADLLGNTTYYADAATTAYTINDAAGNDEYNMDLTGANAAADMVTINDTNGDDDIVVTTSGTGFAFFDVKADGTAKSADMYLLGVDNDANAFAVSGVRIDTAANTKADLTATLAGGFANSIKISNQFVAGTEDDGVGAIEDVAFESFGRAARDYDIDSVRANVAAWLTENGYADTSAALAADTGANAQALLQIYAGIQA